LTQEEEFTLRREERRGFDAKEEEFTLRREERKEEEFTLRRGERRELDAKEEGFTRRRGERRGFDAKCYEVVQPKAPGLHSLSLFHEARVLHGENVVWEAGEGVAVYRELNPLEANLLKLGFQSEFKDVVFIIVILDERCDIRIKFVLHINLSTFR
jgi:hypothetical protein